MDKPIKHVIWYSVRLGRNDGPPLYWFNVLKNKLGLDIVHLDPSLPHDEYGPFDVQWWIDWGEDAVADLGLFNRNWRLPSYGKKIYVSSDTHLGRRYRFWRAEEFDVIGFNQKDAADEYSRLYKINEGFHAGQVVRWLPHAVEPVVYKPETIIKRYEVGFIGHIQDVPNYNGFTRVDFLERMFREFPNFYYGTRNPAYPARNLFEDASHKFNQSKIVLNISIKDDVNMRVFEALGSGAFLLTNWLPSLGELFEDGKHLVTYKTMDEAVEKARYYLAHDDEREKIAAAGLEAVKAHTYEERAKTLLRELDITYTR